MPTHSATTKPTRFERPQLSGFSEQNVMVSGLPHQERRHEICVPQRSSQNADPLLFSGHPRTCSHCCLWILLLANSLQNFTSSRIHAGLVPDLGLHPIDLDFCMSPQLCLQNTIYFDDSRRRAQDVNVIQKHEQLFARAQSLETACSAPCCPRENSKGMRASPCSPPSPW